MIPSVGWIYLWISCFSFSLQGSDVEDEEMQELLNDTRILKKLKKGKITEEDFENQISAQISGPKSKHKAGAATHEGSGGEGV